MVLSKNRIRQNIRALILIVCLAGAAHSPIPAHGAEPIKIGILAFPSKPLALAKWQPLTVVLKQRMPERDFEVLALTLPELDEAVSARQLDFVLTNSGHYVLLKNHGALSAPLASLATDGAGRSLTVYGGVIFSRAEQAKINTLPDIKGKTVAAVDSKSLGGFQMQAYELSRVGVRLPQEIKLIATGLPQGQVVAAVLAGRADVGFVRSGVLEALERQGKLDSKQLKILNRQVLPDFPLLVSTRLYPEWAFAALPQVDEKLARQVVVALFELEKNSAVTRAMGIHGFVVPADYTPVEDVLRELRLPPFDVAPRFTPQDVWSRYRWQSIGALLAGGVILLLGVSVLLMYRRLAAHHTVVLRQRRILRENEEKFRTTAQALEETNLRLKKELAEREAAEQELQSANEQLSVLLDSLPVAIYRCKSEGDNAVLYMSRNVASFTGYAAKDFMEQSDLWFSHVHPDDAPRISAEMALLAEKDRHIFEYRWRNADGTDLWIRDYPRLIIPEDGSPRYLVGMWQNITGDKLAAEALRKANDDLSLFRKLLDSSSDAIEVFDQTTLRYLDVNETACRALGYSREELLAMSVHDIDPNSGTDIFHKTEEKLRESGAVRFETSHRRKDGSTFPVEVSMRSVTLDKLYGLAIVRDITERKQGEEKIRMQNDELEEKVQARTRQLRDAREKLEAHVAEIKQAHDALNQAFEYANTLIRSSPDGVLAVDLDLRITEWNLLMEQMCGKKREQALGQDLTELPFMKATGEGARIREGLEGQNIGPREVAYRLPGMDKESFFESIMAPLRGPAGQIVGAVLRVRDITESKLAEQALAESEARLSSIFDSVRDGIVLADARTRRFRMANASICRMLGYKPDELLSLRIDDIHPEEELANVVRQFGRQLKGEISLVTLPVKRKDGSVFYADISSASVMIGGQQYLTGVFRDITERRLAEEKIRQLNNSLNEKIRQLLAAREDLVRKEKLALLGQVAGIVGHELRNPLAVMSNAVYFLQTVLADADETTREYLEIIKNGVGDAERIVDDLLDSVRTKPPRSAAIGVGELIDQTLRTLTIPAAITVALDLPETLPPVWVDGRQIQQVFRNLIGNGVEAMPEGGTLAIKAVENGRDSTVSVSVRDTGCGMAQEVLTRLFQPLFTTKARGIGLGLVVVNNLTQANGGTIEVESEVGQGTTFTVVLPTGTASSKES